MDVETIALLVGHRKAEVFARAFRRRYGVRPPAYRQAGGRLSRKALDNVRPGRVPPAPRYMAGWAALASGVTCAHCDRVRRRAIEEKVCLVTVTATGIREQL